LPEERALGCGVVDREKLLNALREAANGRPVTIGVAVGDKIFVIGGEVVEVAPIERPSLKRYSQRDPRWANYVLAEEGGIRYTIGSVGCYITCVAMVASLAGYTDTPPEVAEKLRAVGALDGRWLSRPHLIPKAYPRLTFHGIRDWRTRPADIREIRQWLDIAPLILEVEFRPGGPPPPHDQHFVLALRFTDDGEDLIIVDPWDGEEARLLRRYAKPLWDLTRAIYGARIVMPAEI